MQTTSNVSKGFARLASTWVMVLRMGIIQSSPNAAKVSHPTAPPLLLLLFIHLLLLLLLLLHLLCFTLSPCDVLTPNCEYLASQTQLLSST